MSENNEDGRHSVVQFRKAEATKAEAADGPTLQGAAICDACQNEWQAVVPAGDVDHMQCPKCKRFWGSLKHAVEPVTAWVCNCGNRLFWLTPTGAMCRRCGLRSNDWAK